MTSYDAVTGEAFKSVYGPNNEPELHHGQAIPLEEARGMGERCHENAQLIAAMRNALPELLALARSASEAKARLARLESALEFLDSTQRLSISGFTDDGDALRDDDFTPDGLERLAKEMGWNGKAGE
jgi:hypothetical protein